MFWTDFRKIRKYQNVWQTVQWWKSCPKWTDTQTDKQTDRQRERQKKRHDKGNSHFSTFEIRIENCVPDRCNTPLQFLEYLLQILLFNCTTYRCCAEGKPTRWLSRKFNPVSECTIFQLNRHRQSRYNNRLLITLANV